MQFLAKRNLMVAAATFIVGIMAFAAIYGLSFAQTNTTVTSKVVSYLMNDKGEVNGILAENGDQLHFSPETGASIVATVKAGDEITATGRPGTTTKYGRAFHLEQLTVNGQTFTEIKQPKPPRDEPGKHHPPVRDAGGKPMPGMADDEKPLPDEQNKSFAERAGIDAPLNADGIIRAFLIAPRGEIDGLILANGEQIHFSPKIGEQILAANTALDSQVSVTGFGVRNEYGTAIRANKLTIGNQTFTITN